MTLVTAHLALGDIKDPLKHAEHIEAVLCCAKEVPLFPNKPGFHLALRDGFPADDHDLDSAFRFLDEQIQAKRLVLIYCGHGLSRSVSVIVGFLALRNSEAPDVTLGRIRKLRPEVAPSAALFQSIAQYVNRRRSDAAGHQREGYTTQL